MIKNEKSYPILGIDIGGVIIQKSQPGGDTSFFSSNYLKTPVLEDAFFYIRYLLEQKFGVDAIHIISKCGPAVQEKTLHWLEHHHFYEKTGVLRNHVHFCLERKDKAPLCEQFKVTHFIDDSIEVLSYLDRVPSLYLFQPTPSEVNQFDSPCSPYHSVQSWREVTKRILSK